MSKFIIQNVALHSVDELYHWGVPGMKWGVRRYQNKDGTFTDEGKKRYRMTTNREDMASVSAYGATHRKRVMAKYESRKSDAQRQADRNRNKAWDDYQKYVENYSKTHKDTQTRYEHDYDHTKKGQRLIKAFVNASEVRQKAYEGAEWYMQYAKEMERASDRDAVEVFRRR